MTKILQTSVLILLGLSMRPTFAFAADGNKTHVFALYDTAIYQKATKQIIETSAARNIQNISVISNITESLEPNWDGSAAKTKNNLVDGFARLVHSQIKSGELNKNDQVLIQVLTHGGERQLGEETHSVEIGGQAVSLDKLKPILAELKQAGVKVAIFDGSCYSGATHALKSDDVCVMSASTAELPAAEDSRKNGTFVDFFWGDLQKQDPKKKVSLEEAFLKARSQRNSIATTYSWRYDRPQLSSSEASDILDPLLKAMDETRFASPSQFDCSLDNLRKQIALLKSTSKGVVRYYNKELVDKIEKYSEVQAENARLEKAVMAAEDNDQESLYKELKVQYRKVEKEKEELEDEIYKLEAPAYQKYHEDLRNKKGEADPCRSFMI